MTQISKKYCLPKTHYQIVKSFWNFAKSTNTAVLYANFHDLVTEMDVVDEHYFARFEFNTSHDDIMTSQLFITLPSYWSQWCFKSTASWLFTQSFIRAQIKENIKAPRHWPLCGETTGTGEFPAQRARNAENVSIWWRHHVSALLTLLCGEFTGQRWIPLTNGQWYGFWCFFDVDLHKLSNKQSNDRWFPTKWRSCDVIAMASNGYHTF